MWSIWSMVKGFAAAPKSLQSCLTLCDPLDCSPPGSSVHGILQARILEWVAMPSSRGSSWPKNQTHDLLYLLHQQADSLPLTPPGKPGHSVVNPFSFLAGLSEFWLLHSVFQGCPYLVSGIWVLWWVLLLIPYVEMKFWITCLAYECLRTWCISSLHSFHL